VRVGGCTGTTETQGLEYDERLRAALGIAAHELRLPLSHIKGFITTLSRTDVEWDARTRRELLSEADRAVDRLERLIEELLDQSTAGHVAQDRRTRVSPRALVLTTVARLRPMLQDRAVRIDVPTNLPQTELEVPAMERVLANLLQNASKYSPPRAVIDISARHIDGMIEFRVEDRGPGVPPLEYERIFEPFYRGSGHDQGGHGLGLAICRAIVTAHGGRIWAAPRPGGGARFTVTLPLMAPAPAHCPLHQAVQVCTGERGRRRPRTSERSRASSRQG